MHGCRPPTNEPAQCSGDRRIEYGFMRGINCRLHDEAKSLWPCSDKDTVCVDDAVCHVALVKDRQMNMQREMSDKEELNFKSGAVAVRSSRQENDSQTRDRYSIRGRYSSGLFHSSDIQRLSTSARSAPSSFSSTIPAIILLLCRSCRVSLIMALSGDFM